MLRIRLVRAQTDKNQSIQKTIKKLMLVLITSLCKKITTT